MWFLLRMNFQVTLQAWSPHKCFSTLITFMRFLSSVDLHVTLKSWWLCESLPALITCERFLSSVYVHVSLETPFACQTRSTLRAGERFLISSFLWIFLFGLKATQMFFSVLTWCFFSSFSSSFSSFSSFNSEIKVKCLMFSKSDFPWMRHIDFPINGYGLRPFVLYVISFCLFFSVLTLILLGTALLGFCWLSLLSFIINQLWRHVSLANHAPVREV